MRKLFTLTGSIIGGYAGWWLGDNGGLMFAFLLSMVGTGVGMFFGARFGRMYGSE